MKSVLNDFFDRNTTMREGTINLFDLFDLSCEEELSLNCITKVNQNLNKSLKIKNLNLILNMYESCNRHSNSCNSSPLLCL